MQCIKVMIDDEGQIMAMPCAPDMADAEGATQFESMEALMAEMPAMLEKSASMSEQAAEPKPMMDGEQDFVAGFKKARGMGEGY